MSEIILFGLCRFIYTGSVQVTSEIAQDVLRAADQYLLEGLKRLCEYTIAKVIGKSILSFVFKQLIIYNLTKYILAVLQDVNLDNVSDMYDLSEAFHAVSLRHTCILYILEHFNKICTRAGYFLSLITLDLTPPQLARTLTCNLATQFGSAYPACYPGAPQFPNQGAEFKESK
jgi:hypothetical protein